eukprot:366443-Chlamydomonas_euryale.AAC.13
MRLQIGLGLDGRSRLCSLFQRHGIPTHGVPTHKGPTNGDPTHNSPNMGKREPQQQALPPSRKGRGREGGAKKGRGPDYIRNMIVMQPNVQSAAMLMSQYPHKFTHQSTL